MTRDFQPTLTGEVPRFDPMKQGLYRRFYNDGGFIEYGQWSRAIAEGLPVGTCRRCGADLRPERPVQVNATRTDYTAVCRDERCEWVYNAPGGRVLGRSSRWSERRDKHGR